MSNYLTKLLRSIDGAHLRDALFEALRGELLSAAKLERSRPVGRVMSSAALIGVGAAGALSVLAFVPAARRAFFDSADTLADEVKRIAQEASDKAFAAVGGQRIAVAHAPAARSAAPRRALKRGRARRAAHGA